MTCAYAPTDLSQKKSERLADKLNKVPDLVVFEKVSDEGACNECGVELANGNLHFVGTIKLISYRAETALVHIVREKMEVRTTPERWSARSFRVFPI